MAQLTLRHDGAVAVVGFGIPPLGCMDQQTVSELAAIMAAIEADAATRAVVFTGTLPGVFIRHYSVEELATLAERLRARGLRFDPARPAPEHAYGAVLRRIEEMDKVSIAAINGICMGGGFEFALACDIRIAQAGDYPIGLPEINIGLLPGAGGTQKLARLVGQARALEMLLRGRTVSPAEAMAFGMIHEVTADALQQALFQAQEIAEKSPLAVAHIKRLLRASREASLAEGQAMERTLFLDLLTSDKAIELMRRMLREGADIRSV
jgi:enoyl-CoA hydratase/carnithine racemase